MDTAKAVLKEKFIVKAYIKNEKNLQINNLMMKLRELEMLEEMKPKINRRKKNKDQSRNKMQLK